LKVLHFFKTYLPDSFTGTERVIWEIAEGTARYGIETEVLSLSREPAQRSVAIGSHFAHKVRLDFSLASTDFSFSAPSALSRLAAKADVVHYHFPYPFADLVHFLSRVRRPFVVTYHSDVVRQKRLLQAYRPLMLAFLARADRIVATSPNYLASSTELQRYRDKVTVIPIGIDANAMPVPDAALLQRWRERLPPRFFLFVGALRYYKGLTYLLEAARASGLPVVIAGDGEEGARLRAAVEGMGNVTFVGHVSDEDKAALLALSHAFVFPSHLRSEAFGVALLEAAAVGRPLISCEIGTGTSYVNIAGETGLVIPPADSAALAGAMQKLWGDDAMAARMGAAAKLRALTVFSADKMAADYAALYRQVARRV
jgi:rhamnosyl/mannosyltransferase